METEQQHAWMAQAMHESDGSPADIWSRFEAIVRSCVEPFSLPTLDAETRSSVLDRATYETFRALGCPETLEELAHFEIATLYRYQTVTQWMRLELMHPLVRKLLLQRRAATL